MIKTSIKHNVISYIQSVLIAVYTTEVILIQLSFSKYCIAWSEMINPEADDYYQL